MACYLKWETYSGPISFEVQWNDIWTGNIQLFEMPFSSTVLGAIELFNESQLGEV